MVKPQRDYVCCCNIPVHSNECSETFLTTAQNDGFGFFAVCEKIRKRFLKKMSELLILQYFV